MEPQLSGLYLRVLINTPTTKVDKLLGDTIKLSGNSSLAVQDVIPFSFGEVVCEAFKVLHVPAFCLPVRNGVFTPFKQSLLNIVAVYSIEPWYGINHVGQLALLIVIQAGRDWFQHSTHSP